MFLSDSTAQGTGRAELAYAMGLLFNEKTGDWASGTK